MDKDIEIDQALYDNADKFLELANEMSRISSSANIGVAIRYAAARYSAFEASLGTPDLEKHKNEHLRFFAETFTEMLHKNFDEYIAQQKENK